MSFLETQKTSWKREQGHAEESYIVSEFEKLGYTLVGQGRVAWPSRLGVLREVGFSGWLMQMFLCVSLCLEAIVSIEIPRSGRVCSLVNELKVRPRR